MPPCPRDLRARESIELGRVAKVKSTHTEFHGVLYRAWSVERVPCARARGRLFVLALAFTIYVLTNFCIVVFAVKAVRYTGPFSTVR